MSQRLTRGRAARSNSAVLDQESDLNHQVAQPAAATRTRKRTRVNPAAAPIPEDEVAPPVVTTTVAASTVTATANGSSRTTTTTRKTRSLRSAVDNSPLKSLDTVPKIASKRKRVAQKQVTQDHALEAKHEQEELDPDRGLFFKKGKKVKVEAPDDEKLHMSPDSDSLLEVMALRAEIERLKHANSSLQTENAAVKADYGALEIETAAVKADYGALKIETAAVKADYGALKIKIDNAQSANHDLWSKNGAMTIECDILTNEHYDLKTNFNTLEDAHNNLQQQHQELQDKLLSTQKQLRKEQRMTNNTQKALRTLQDATAPKADTTPVRVEPSAEAIAVLRNIEKQRDDHYASRGQLAVIDQNQNNDQQEQTDAISGATSAEADHEMNDTQEEPEQESASSPAQHSSATPARTTAVLDNTPRTTGWGLKSLISRFVPAFTSPAPAPVPTVAPATAPPAVLQPAQAQNLANTLQPTPPTPTPATERRRRAPGPHASTVRAQKQAQRMTQRRPPSDARAFVICVANSVKREDTNAAVNWAKGAFQKLKLADPSTIGEKRKCIEAGVKMGDLKSLPARTPWQSAGTFSFHGEVFDLDDDELAPAWCVLQEMLDDMGIGSDSPPAKKRKTAQEDTTMDQDITPINETDVSALNGSTSRSHVNTHGNSASLSDLEPRSSRIPSPMFSGPSDHNPTGNVFKQQEQALAKSAEETKLDEEYMRQLRIKMKKEGELWSTPSTAAREEAYSMALHDQEENERKQAAEENAKKKKAAEKAKVPAEGAPLWTQQPPPAPTPAHASLPTPLTASPAVPPVQAEEPVVPPVSPPMDPVERQRAKLMKHTPARPSRLREATIPSPSIRSDYGASPLQIGPSQWSFVMPDPELLDLGDSRLVVAAEALVASDAYKARNLWAYGGADISLEYEDNSEEEL